MNTYPQHSPGDQRWFANMDSAAVRAEYNALLTQAGGRLPWPGTAEWCALDRKDPRKSAAVVLVALFWIDAHTIEALTEQAEVNEYFDRSAEKQAALVMSQMWQERSLYQETFAELRRRRAVVPPIRKIDPDAVARWVATGSSKPAQEENAA